MRGPTVTTTTQEEVNAELEAWFPAEVRELPHGYENAPGEAEPPVEDEPSAWETGWEPDINVVKWCEPSEPEGGPDDNVVKWSEPEVTPTSWWMALRKDEPDIKDALDIMLKGRDCLEMNPPSLVSPATSRKYSMWSRRMEAEGASPDEMAPRYALKTAYVIRAAYIDEVLSKRLPEAMEAGRRAIMDMDPDGLVSAAQAVEEALGRLGRFPPDRTGKGGNSRHSTTASMVGFYEAARKRAVEIHGPGLELATANPRLSRRTILHRLPKGWRDRIWSAALASGFADHNKAPFAIMRLVGCRPQEIEDGIMLEVSGKKLSITVLYPAKSHHEKYGLGTRTHTMRIIGSQAKWLADYTTSHGGRIKVSVPRNRLLEISHELSKREFPAIRPPVVPYDFRHQYSADMKAMASRIFPDSPSEKVEFVARRMGHSATKSQWSYGTARQSGGAAETEADTVTFKDPSRKVRHYANKLADIKARTHGPSV